MARLIRRFSVRRQQRRRPQAWKSLELAIDAKMRRRKANRAKGLSEFLGRAVLLSDKKSSNNARFLLPLVAKRGRPIGRQKNNPKTRKMETVRMKKKKGGRPTKKLKRELRITARFSKLEHYILQQKAGKAGINVSEFLRQAAITAKVIARLTEEERNIIRQLIGMANNLNQMAKVANREGMGSIRLLLESCLQQVHGLLNKLQHGE